MAELMTGKRWHSREDSGLRLDRELRWWHDDERIEHPRIVELFNSSLGLDDSGRFVLRIGNDWARVAVEDAAYEVRTVDVSPGDRLSVRLSDRTAELLDPATLSVEPDGVVTCLVKEGRAKARFSRDAQFQFGAFLSVSDGGVSLEVGARRDPLPGALAQLFHAD